MINTIILVGPRASGKTTVGKMLAARLKLNFIDTDEVVQKKTNKTIAQIVDEQGWDNFRTIEGRILKEVTLSGCIIATGGGMVIAQENRNYMKNKGIVFYLATSVETVVKRLRSDPAVSQRPSLTGLSITEEIGGIINTRDPLYQESAHFVIDANNGKEQVAQEINAIYHTLLNDAANDAAAIPPRL
ncbi:MULTISPECIES: shikimate kinase AroL [unclassified Brenneria]|uniref:shikimate kinase AroL n=1 Tax=unclassified Brenneria TaxID=2634434 RepID=UPI0029C55835|nr:MULTISPECIES: shikimate kinase AroL [unclassified Brenneria]MDX5629795.1 shikimate kinase AroL [Brenneria sp. L3-3Z]MDX5696941.1 shikimate kinase AroL [Brenneria sp. L4-2C]